MNNWTIEKVGEFTEELKAEEFMMNHYLENGFYRKENQMFMVYTELATIDVDNDGNLIIG